MAFKKVQNLNPDTMISLGGINKKTGKKNPVSVEGYYLGRNQFEDRKKKSGIGYTYVFQTEDGSVGVWGKTDLDKKMSGATPGQMMRLTFLNMRKTPNGDMYVYEVEFDPENTIEVAAVSDNDSSEESEQDDDSASDDPDGSDANDDYKADTSDAAQLAAQEAAEARKVKVQALLNGKGKKA